MWRIALLLIISSAIPVTASLFLLGEISLMFAATYPFFLASVIIIAPIFHIYIVKNKLKTSQQLFGALILGLITGAVISMLAFGEEITHMPRGRVLPVFLTPMCAYGIMQALISWTLYTYGPLRIAK